MSTASLLTGGDVAPDRDKGTPMFGAVGSRFRAADVSFFNLEGPLSGYGAPVPGKGICFRGAPHNVEGIAEAGISCVNLANNHVLDFGERALLETMEHLQHRQIGCFGAGRTLDTARNGCALEEGGVRIGFLGYTTTLPAGYAATPTSPGVNPIAAYTAYQPVANPLEYPGSAPRIVTWADPATLRRMSEDVAALAGQVEVVIVYVHWGASMSPHVHDFQREIGMAAIDAGAHAVFGGHNHVLSAIEFHRGRPIVYCSGNLIFDHRIAFFTRETRKTFLFGATVDRAGLRDCYLLPAATGVGEPPRLLPRHDALWNEIHQDIQSLSRGFGTRLLAREDAIELLPD